MHPGALNGHASFQGTLVDENGTTHDEILRKYEQAVAENTTLRLQIQDASTAIDQLRQDLDTTAQARDIEHDRAEMLAEIVEEREDECAQIASAAEDKQQVLTVALTYMCVWARKLSLTLTCCADCDRATGDA